MALSARRSTEERGNRKTFSRWQQQFDDWMLGGWANRGTFPFHSAIVIRWAVRFLIKIAIFLFFRSSSNFSFVILTYGEIWLPSQAASNQGIPKDKTLPQFNIIFIRHPSSVRAKAIKIQFWSDFTDANLPSVTFQCQLSAVLQANQNFIPDDFSFLCHFSSKTFPIRFVVSGILIS